MSENILTPLERQSLELLLSRENWQDEKVRQQLDAVSVRRREQSDVGMFVELDVPAHMASDERARHVFSNLSGEMPGLKNGFGAVLYVEDGLLHTLEFFTYDEVWPERPENYRLFLEGA